MEIQIQTIKPPLIRNDQIGDWKYSETRPFFIVNVSSNIKSDESKLAVSIHELIEAFLCKKAGIEDQTVCQFDQMFEEERQRGLHDEFAEDGDDARCPYLKEHQAATDVERSVVAALGLSWSEHESHCSLPQQFALVTEAGHH